MVCLCDLSSLFELNQKICSCFNRIMFKTLVIPKETLATLLWRLLYQHIGRVQKRPHPPSSLYEGRGGRFSFGMMRSIGMNCILCIYLTNILSVGLSVRLQKAKELRYLWMVSSLFCFINITSSSNLMVLLCINLFF